MEKNHLMKFAFSVPAIALACCILTQPSALSADGEWHVKEATIRFKVSLANKPADKSSGYVLNLPDGGILPGPLPLTHVVTEGGKAVPSYVLWQNKGTGTLMTFEDPGVDGNVFIYVSGADKLKLWSSQTGIKPGPVVCAEQGTDSLETARNLGKLGQVGPHSYFSRFGTSMSPLGMQGDIQGRPNPICYYLLAYVITKDPGRTLVALTVMNGNVKIIVDGQPITPQKISSKPGGTGQWMDLSKGLHKVEALCSIGLTGTSTEGKGQWCVWTMGWRPPHASIEDLGGPRPKDLPAPGTPMWESHKINPEEIARSGECKIREIATKDGTPVAAFNMEGIETFWFGDEPPIFAYELTGLPGANPEDTTYTWSFGDAAKISGQKIYWFFRGGNQTATMTAASKGKQSTATVPFYAHSGAKSSMDSTWTKDNFRKACVAMVKAYPPEIDPTATWSTTMWNCFYDAMEFGKGSDLLEEILTKRWSFFSKKVPIEKQVMMEDIFFNWIAQNDPDKAMQWLKNQEATSPSIDRKGDLKIMQAEVLMYQKNNLAEAKKILQPLAKGAGDVAATANIRLGDIAFLEKDLNTANNYWGLVQNAVKMTKTEILGEGSQVKWDDGSSDKKKKKNQIEPEAKAFTSTAIKNERVDGWKKTAVMDTSKALGIMALIQQGFMLDAYQELRRWERALPMSKINSDYIMQEASFYMSIGNSKRARKQLESYCEIVDASAYVASASELLLQCMMKDKESDKVLKKFCEDMIKRYEFHPMADRMKDLMRVIGTDGIKREATLDKL